MEHLIIIKRILEALANDDKFALTMAAEDFLDVALTCPVSEYTMEISEAMIEELVEMIAEYV